VPAQTSSFHFRSGGIDVRAIGDSLGVEALLEGSIKEEGDRIRVTVQLIDARDGLHRFTETYDRRLESHLDLQVEIARATIAALGIDLPVGWSPVRPQTGDTLAWYYYAKARHWWRKRTQAGTDTALVYFRRATERDSSFVNAWAGRVNAYATGEVWDHLAIDDSLGAELWAIIDLALRLDPNSVEALNARATGLIGRGEIEAAEKDYRRIFELNPNFALGHLWYADLLSNTERYEAALREARRADELDPMSPIGKKVLADILRNNLRLDEAVQQYDYAIQLEPSFASPVRNKAWALVCMGLFEDARRTLARVDELDGEWPYTARMVYLMGDFEGAEGMMRRVRAGGRDDDPSLMAYILTEMGRYDDARAEYRKAADRAPGDPSVDLVLAYVYVREGASRRALEIVEHVAYVDHDPRVYFNLASIYGALGDRDRAFELLEQAHAGRKPQVMTLKVNPRFVDLRGDPRFAAFLDQVGLR